MSARFLVPRMNRLIFAVTLLLLRPLFAQDIEPRCNRPLLVPEGRGLVGFDIAADLSAGREGRRVEVGSFHAGDHRDGLSVAFGPSKGFELGFALQMIFHQSRTTHFNRASGTDFGGFYTYGAYAFLPSTAFEVGLQALSKAGWSKARVRKVALVFALPTKINLVPGRLSLRLRPELFMGFALKYYEGDKDPPQYTLIGTAGLTFNMTPSVFFDLAFGGGKVLKGRDLDVQGFIAPSTKVFLPVSVQAGYSFTEDLDLALSFSFPDLRELGVDARFLTISMEYRY